jgi:mono/diheme cytochrome c family protein/glucose/arabinose dehydrogenase
MEANGMRAARMAALGILLAVAGLGGAARQQSPSGRPWPPGVQKVPDTSPPRPPAEALQTFYMPPGYRLELVASEPLVQEPVAIDWDIQGRLWVVEMPGFMANLTGSNEYEPIGRVVVLEDTDADGRMDRRTVFADGLVLARSLKVLDRGVLVAEPPHVWLMRDIDGDLRADSKEEITNQYGRREIDPQNNANGFDWSLDNWMHTAGQSEIQLRLTATGFEVARTLRRGEWGITHDDVGRLYRNTNESALHVDYVPTSYYARHPGLLRTRGSYERLATDNPDLNVVWPVRPNPGTNRAYQVGIDRPDGSLQRFTSVCAPLVYRGDRLPAELYGNVFVAEPAANLVGRILLDSDGRTIRARKAYAEGEFLASTDERFRPVYFSNAPDGLLYVVDLYRGIIEHRISITEYLRDQILARRLDRPNGLGRIYRVVHESSVPDRLRLSRDVSSGRLVELLSHPNGWWRDTAQRMLVERRDRSVVPALAALASQGVQVRTRLHALWTVDGLEAIDPMVLTRALGDPSEDVRAAAIRIAERSLAAGDAPVRAAVLTRLDDPSWTVRRQLAASLGVLPAGHREADVVAVVERWGVDPITMDLALSGLRGVEVAALERLVGQDQPSTPEREALLTLLAATVIRSTQDAAIQRVFEWIGATTEPDWRRSALLAGAESALTGRALPGAPTPPARQAGPAAAAAPLPCPTCPGGRAGPGGAYAFPRPQASNAARGGGGGLRLSRPPSGLLEGAARGDHLSARATDVLARITWPGKPGAAASVPALSPAEQQRFDAGHEVYRNLCQACHQSDGRGQDRLAPALVDSAILLAPAGIPLRVLLNGKEGATGLMPPIGASLTDEQLASVLTYVRREWGQTGTPVTPVEAAAVRAQTAGRPRPWTEPELEQLLPARPSPSVQ